MSDADLVQCSNCRFSVAKEDDIDHCICKRYPNRITKYNNDWCGEFSKKETFEFSDTQTIECLGLSRRTRKILKNNGIKRIGDLVYMSSHGGLLFNGRRDIELDKELNMVLGKHGVNWSLE